MRSWGGGLGTAITNYGGIGMWFVYTKKIEIKDTYKCRIVAEFTLVVHGNGSNPCWGLKEPKKSLKRPSEN